MGDAGWGGCGRGCMRVLGEGRGGVNEMKSCRVLEHFVHFQCDLKVLHKHNTSLDSLVVLGLVVLRLGEIVAPWSEVVIADLLFVGSSIHLNLHTS